MLQYQYDETVAAEMAVDVVEMVRGEFREVAGITVTEWIPPVGQEVSSDE